MRVSVHFYSYFKELTGNSQISETLAEGSTLAELLKALFHRYPKLSVMEKAMLVAVGVDYQPRNHVLRDGDEVSLFPPVQGG